MIGFLLAIAQTAAAIPSAPQLPPAVAIPEPAQNIAVKIPVGTGLQLRLLSDLSTKRNMKGDTFELEVSQDVVIGGHVVIPAGTIAVGELTRSDPKGPFGESGKLEARVLYAKLPQGSVRLSGRLGIAGEGGTAATVVTAFLVGTLAFAVTGKTAVIPAGTSLIASTDRSVSVQVHLPTSRE